MGTLDVTVCPGPSGWAGLRYGRVCRSVFVGVSSVSSRSGEARRRLSSWLVRSATLSGFRGPSSSGVAAILRGCAMRSISLNRIGAMSWCGLIWRTRTGPRGWTSSSARRPTPAATAEVNPAWYPIRRRTRRCPRPRRPSVGRARLVAYRRRTLVRSLGDGDSSPGAVCGICPRDGVVDLGVGRGCDAKDDRIGRGWSRRTRPSDQSPSTGAAAAVASSP